MMNGLIGRSLTLEMLSGSRIRLLLTLLLVVVIVALVIALRRKLYGQLGPRPACRAAPKARCWLQRLHARHQRGSSEVIRSRNALLITETDERLIASAAIIGDNSQPVNGNSRPAASGTPSML